MNSGTAMNVCMTDVLWFPQGEVETLGETVADVVERLQQLDEQVVALDARMSSVPQEVRAPSGRPIYDPAPSQSLEWWLSIVRHQHPQRRQHIALHCIGSSDSILGGVNAGLASGTPGCAPVQKPSSYSVTSHGRRCSPAG